jgi:transposase
MSASWTALVEAERSRRPGDIARFPPPLKLSGYTGLCTRLPVGRQRPPRPAPQAGTPLPALGAGRGRHPRQQPPRYRDPYQRTKQRLGRQRGPKVAQVDLARRLAEAIWHMLTGNYPFAPAGPTDPLAVGPVRCATGASLPSA